MTTAAAAGLALAAWLGAVAGRVVGAAHAGPVDGAPMIGLAGGVVGLLVLLAWRAGRSRGDGAGTALPAWLVAAAGVTLATTALAAGVRTSLVVAGPVARLVSALPEESDVGQGRRAAVQLRVRLVEDPVEEDSGAWRAFAVVHAVRHAGSPSWLASGERVRLRAPPPAPPFGTTLHVRGVVAPSRGPAAAWLRSRGVVVEVRAVEVVRLRGPPGWVGATTALRDRLRLAVRGFPPAEGALLTGLVTGDVRGQSEPLRQAFATSGLSHLVAVSGSNVALVIAGALWLLLSLGAGRRAALWACLALVWWFVVLVRAEPSVVRAALMASLVIGSLLIGRLRDPRQVLAVAVLLALLLDPMLVGRVGFALSVTATAGVLTVAPRIRDRLPGPRGVRSVLAATIGAQLCVAPALLLAGLPVGLAGIPANVVAVPAAAVASLVGAVAALLAIVSPAGAGLVAGLARPPLAVVLWSARTFGGPVGGAVDRLWVWLLVAAGAVWLVHRASARRRGRGPSRVVTAVAVAGIAWTVLVGPAVPGRPPDTPVLIALDVGQGDALLVGDPAGGWMLVDGGPDPSLLQAGLRRHAVADLQAVVLTHPHADHHDGLEGLFDVVDVGVVVVGPAMASVGGRPVEVEAAAAGVRVHQLSVGASWRHGGMLVEVLSPPAGGIDSDLNESSLVLRLTTSAGATALLTGDAELIAQTLLLRRPERLDVDVLKVPHHGGDTNAEGFLAATTPEVAVVSAGEGNPFGHPHPDVLADLAGVDVRRTDRQGDVVVPLSVP